LASRGLALSGTLLPALIAPKATDLVPSTLAATIQKGALAVVTGQAAAAAFSTKVAALAQSTLNALILSKLKMVLIVLAAAGMLGGGMILGARWLAADKPAGLLPTLHAWANTFHRHIENLQGTWDLISLEKDGQAASAEEVKQRKLVWIIQADQIVMQSADGQRTAMYSVDPSRSPRRIDLIFASDPGKSDETLRGIYTRKDEILQVCYDPKGGLRPDQFETAVGRNALLLGFKKRY
ncbi:MAG TPA: TIGR03067 domain-containing protein, partial [Gemmataceae bacterium]|nr:TIGR03067 domain-containing protein [Gemmataceae bacterium]